MFVDLKRLLSCKLKCLTDESKMNAFESKGGGEVASFDEMGAMVGGANVMKIEQGL
jgi:hypothetical protein